MAKKRKSNGNFLGGWAFLIGVVLAVVLGFLGLLTDVWIYVLVVLGLIVGLLNITSKETHPFLLSGVVLVIASGLGQSVLSRVAFLNGILDALLAIFVPAIIIVAIRHVFSLARR